MRQQSRVELKSSLRSHRLRNSPEILKTVNAGAVTICPARLNCVTANNLKIDELETVVRVTRVGSHDISEHIRLATTGRARTGASEKLKIEIRFRRVIPLNGELVSDLLNVRRLQAHWDFKFTTMSILRAILALGLLRS